MRARHVLLWVLLELACSHRGEQGGIFTVHEAPDGKSGSWSIDCTRSASDCVTPLDAGFPLAWEPSWADTEPEPIRCAAGKVCTGDWVSGGYSPAARDPGPVPQPR